MQHCFRVAALALGLATSPAFASFIIVPTWASAIASDANAATIEATINSVISTYEAKITDNVTVNITFDEMSTGLGQSSVPVYGIGYSTFINALFSHSASVDDATALVKLSKTATSDPVDSQTLIFLKGPIARALGVGTFAANHTTNDGTISLKTSIMNLSRTGGQNSSYYDLQSVVEHEIDEVLGLGSGLGLSYAMPEDLFRYASVGSSCASVSGRSYTATTTAKSCFSINGSASLAQFNNTGSGDYGDWLTTATQSSPGSARVQDATGTPGAQANLGVEWQALDVIGYTMAATATPEPATWMLAAPIMVAGLLRRRRIS